MFPMVTSVQELLALRAACERLRAELDAPVLPVGIMIEVPAAALRVGEFAGLVDFVSIGTNDLAQYALASDRTNAAVADLAPLDDPAVWRLIELTCQGLPGVPMAVCGNLASEPAAAERLIAMGVTELSVRPPLVPQVKQAVRRASGAAGL